MERKNKEVFWNGFLFNKSKNEESPEDEVTIVPVGEEKYKVVQTDQEIFLQSKDENTGEWITKYTKTKLAPKDYQITSGYLKLIKQNVVILSTSTGNADFLHYTIIGRINGKLVKLAGNEFVYNGDIFFEGDKLIQKSANRFSRWTIKNGRLMLVPIKAPKIPGALRIEFYIAANGYINVDNTTYSVPVGTVVQFVRTDINTYPEKGYFYLNEQSEDLVEEPPEQTQVFKIIKAGRIEGKIRAENDFDKEITITIDAK